MRNDDTQDRYNPARLVHNPRRDLVHLMHNTRRDPHNRSCMYSRNRSRRT